MKDIKLFLFCVVWLVSIEVSASDIYDCTEVYTSGFKYDSNLWGKLIVSNDDGKPVEPSKLKIKIESNGVAFLEGNQGTSRLIGVSDRQFLEKTDSGNIILWTFFSGSRDKKYRILVMQKSYEIFMMPMTFTSVYECR